MSHARPSAAPRVMQVITPSRMAGAETALVRLVRHTPAEQARYHCVTGHTQATRELLAAGLDFETLGINGKANLLAPWRLARAARRFDADLLHSHLSTASWWCGWLERFGGPPSVGHVHGFTSALWHRHQSVLIACSRAVKDDLVRQGVTPHRVHVLHWPVEPADLSPARPRAAVRAELGAERDTPVVGTFAHLSEKKGHLELVAAARRVIDQLPAAQFWCFGEGPLRTELANRIAQAGLGRNVRLFGFRRDVADLLQAIDVMALPSHREPFGLVYVEAALAERPAIACQAGGAPEIIIAGETGLLVPPKDPAALTGAILELLGDRARAAAMGRRARQSVLDRFRWEDFLRRLSEIYDSLREVGRGSRPRQRRAA